MLKSEKRDEIVQKHKSSREIRTVVHYLLRSQKGGIFPTRITINVRQQLLAQKLLVQNLIDRQNKKIVEEEYLKCQHKILIRRL